MYRCVGQWVNSNQAFIINFSDDFINHLTRVIRK